MRAAHHLQAIARQRDRERYTAVSERQRDREQDGLVKLQAIGLETVGDYVAALFRAEAYVVVGEPRNRHICGANSVG